MTRIEKSPNAQNSRNVEASSSHDGTKHLDHIEKSAGLSDANESKVDPNSTLMDKPSTQVLCHNLSLRIPDGYVMPRVGIARAINAVLNKDIENEATPVTQQQSTVLLSLVKTLSQNFLTRYCTPEHLQQDFPDTVQQDLFIQQLKTSLDTCDDQLNPFHQLSQLLEQTLQQDRPNSGHLRTMHQVLLTMQSEYIAAFTQDMKSQVTHIIDTFLHHYCHQHNLVGQFPQLKDQLEYVQDLKKSLSQPVISDGGVGGFKEYLFRFLDDPNVSKESLKSIGKIVYGLQYMHNSLQQLSIEAQIKSLVQFPPRTQDELQCLQGSRQRLAAVNQQLAKTLQPHSATHQQHNTLFNEINKGAIVVDLVQTELTRDHFIRTIRQGEQIHAPMSFYAIMDADQKILDTADGFARTVDSKLSPAQAFSFQRAFPHTLSKELNEVIKSPVTQMMVSEFVDILHWSTIEANDQDTRPYQQLIDKFESTTRALQLNPISKAMMDENNNFNIGPFLTEQLLDKNDPSSVGYALDLHSLQPTLDAIVVQHFELTRSGLANSNQSSSLFEKDYHTIFSSADLLTNACKAIQTSNEHDIRTLLDFLNLGSYQVYQHSSPSLLPTMISQIAMRLDISQEQLFDQLRTAAVEDQAYQSKIDTLITRSNDQAHQANLNTVFGIIHGLLNNKVLSKHDIHCINKIKLPRYMLDFCFKSMSTQDKIDLFDDAFEQAKHHNFDALFTLLPMLAYQPKQVQDQLKLINASQPEDHYKLICSLILTDNRHALQAALDCEPLYAQFCHQDLCMPVHIEGILGQKTINISDKMLNILDSKSWGGHLKTRSVTEHTPLSMALAYGNYDRALIWMKRNPELIHRRVLTRDRLSEDGRRLNMIECAIKNIDAGEQTTPKLNNILKQLARADATKPQVAERRQLAAALKLSGTGKHQWQMVEALLEVDQVSTAKLSISLIKHGRRKWHNLLDRREPYTTTQAQKKLLTSAQNFVESAQSESFPLKFYSNKVASQQLLAAKNCIALLTAKLS